MPRFFFDSSDGSGWEQDNVGLEVTDIETAHLEANRALLDIARDALPSTAPERMSIVVHDHARRPSLRVTLALTTEALA